MYCHVNVKTGSRGTGQSAAAKYDYISRIGKYGAACQDEVVHLESGSMPSFASSDARLYWAAADSHERSNGRLFRSLTAALPNSLDAAGRLDLARSFAAHVTGGELPYTLALHAGLSKKAGVADNPHLHLVFSERVNDGVARAAEQWFRRAAPKGGDPAAGGARKSERTKPRAWLDETRQAWAAEMNLAFDRAGVADRVTSESHAAQLARAREAGDAAEEERLLLNPPSEHIGPAAKHRWEDRSSGAPELKPDRYAAYEEASASAREVRSAHARDAAEAAEARLMVETLDAEIAALEAEQRRADAAARREVAGAARSGTAPCRGEAGRGEESPPNGSRRCARGRGAVPREPGRPRSEVERGRQRRDDGRPHRCGPRRRRVGRDAPRPASRRAVGRGGRRPVPSAARQSAAAVRDGGSRRRRRGGRSAAQARLSREGAVRGAGRRRGARRSPRPPQPVLVAHGDADRHRARARCRRAAIGPAAGGYLGAPGGSRRGTAVPGCPEHGVAANGRGVQRAHRDRPAGQAAHADAVGSRPRSRHRDRAARAAGVIGPGEAALRVGAGARRKTAGQVSPVEGGAP